MDDVVVGWLVGRSVGGCVFERQLTSGWLVSWLVGSSENDSGLFDGGTGTSSYICATAEGGSVEASGCSCPKWYSSLPPAGGSTEGRKPSRTCSHVREFFGFFVLTNK